MKILVVDDEPRLREIVTVALTRGGFDVVTAANGQLALIHAERDLPALIVLDVGLPEMGGFDVCRRIRQNSDVPILFLTAHDDEVARVLGFELGADDYVTKPFSPRELVARVRAILKRTGEKRRGRALRHGPILLDPSSHSCTVGHDEINLTATEFIILGSLMRHATQIHDRRQLIERIWGTGSQVSDRTLDSHMRNLRRKLAEAGCADAIETVHGVGMRMRRKIQ